MSNIALEDVVENCNTGDLLLYSTSKWYSKIIEYFTGSKFSHISIILKNPIYLDKQLKGLYILESGLEPTPDPTDGKFKFGVQITKLSDVIKMYKDSNMGTLYYRKLTCERNDKFIDRIKNTYTVVKNKPYDITIFDWIKAEFKIKIGNENKTSEFWCSSLVAFVYFKLGFLTNIRWTIISPQEFSYFENHKDLKFLNCKLYPEQFINLS